MTNTGFFGGFNPLTFDASDDTLLFIIQLLFILVMSRLIYFLLRFLKQPRVISEIVAGILIGPSALGQIASYRKALFPPASLSYINLVAQFGLVFFLFLVGLELDPRVMMRNLKNTLIIATIQKVLCFAVSALVALVLLGERTGKSKEYSYGLFFLFLSVAISITAFPVLARILSELNLLNTAVGIQAISLAAIDDATAWCLLALVVSIVNATNGLTALWILITGIVYVAFMLTGGRIFFKWLVDREKNQVLEEGPSTLSTLITFVVVLLSAWFTGALGIHPIFGGFIAGVIIPHDYGFAVKMAEKLEDFVSMLFLPLFFALSGLKTEIGLLNDWRSWGFVLLVIVASVLAQVIGVGIGARLVKLPFRESLALGFLMTCRGLVELIVLNIGLDSGVLDKKIFTMFVIMALATTALTAPAVHLIYPPKYQKQLGVIDSKRPSLISTTVSVRHDPGVHQYASEKNRILLCIDKLAEAPAAMQLLALLNVPGAQTNSDIHVLRLLAMTPRFSSIIRSTDFQQSIRNDPIAQIVHSLSTAYNLAVRCTLSVALPHHYSSVIARQAEEDLADLCILPIRLIDDAEGAEQISRSSAQLQKHISTELGSQQIEIIQELLEKVPVRTTVAVMLDRGLLYSSLHVQSDEEKPIEGSTALQFQIQQKSQNTQQYMAMKIVVILTGSTEDTVSLNFCGHFASKGCRTEVIMHGEAFIRDFSNVSVTGRLLSAIQKDFNITTKQAATETELLGHLSWTRPCDLVVLPLVHTIDGNLPLGQLVHALDVGGCQASIMVLHTRDEVPASTNLHSTIKEGIDMV